MAGSAGLITSGTGVTYLTAANTYTGGTDLSQGTLQLNSATAASSGTISLGDGNTGANNIQLNINNASLANAIVVSGSGSGTATISYLPASGTFTTAFGNIAMNGPATFTFPNLTNWMQFNSVLSGSGALNVGTSNGQRMILNINSPSYTGNITVLSGAVFEPRGFLTTANGNNITVNAGGLLAVDTATTTSIAGLNGSGGTVGSPYNSGATLSVGLGNASGSFSGTMINDVYTLSFTKTGTGRRSSPARASSTPGATTVSGGTLVLQNATGFASTSIANGGTLQFDLASGTSQTYSNAISGGGAVVKTSPGTLTLAGVNSYNGGTTISAGLVKDGVTSNTAGAFGAFNAAASTITIQSGATVDVNGANDGADFFYGLTIAGSGTSGQGR